METEKLNAKEIGEAYAQERFKGAYVAFPVAMANGDILTANVPVEEMRKIVRDAFNSGDGNGYQRGKADAERRIWDKLPYSYATREIKQIIFGGGDVPKTDE